MSGEQTSLFQEEKRKTNDKTLDIHKKVGELVELLNRERCHYFIVAGKDGISSNYINGDKDDLHGMLSGMMERNSEIDEFIHSLCDQSDNVNIETKQ